MKKQKLKLDDLEIHCESLIEFSSLTKVLLELVKRQKKTEKKLEEHDYIINILKKDKNINTDIFLNSKENDDSLNEESDLENNDSKSNSEENSKEHQDRNMSVSQLKEDSSGAKINKKTDDISASQNQSEKNELNESMKEEKEKNIEENKNIQKEVDENISNLKEKSPDSKIDSSKKNNSEITPKILNKIKEIEKRLNDVYSKSKKINSLSKGLEDIKKKFINFNNDFDTIKEKVQDFDVYDVFKGNDDGSGVPANVDVCKGLIKALETKMGKKIELIQSKIKLNVDDIETNKNHIKQNIMPNIDNLKKNNKEFGDKLSNLEKALENYQNEDSDNLQIIEKKIDLNNKNIKSNEENIKLLENNLINKIKELEQKLNQEIKNFITNKETDSNKEDNLSSEEINYIKSLGKKIGELEKEFKAKMSKIKIDEINNKLTSLKKEIDSKAGKFEINELNETVNSIDNIVKDQSFKIETIQQLQDKLRSENSQINKKIENIAGELTILKYNMESHKEEKPIDLSRFIDSHQLNEVKKDANIKIEKIKNNLEALGRSLEELSKKLNQTPTDADFSNYQNSVKTMLNELKLNCNKKYCEKYDTMKTIKFLETRIQSIQDSFNQKNDGSDNWLLAKKPMNPFLCASCESVIRGELDKRGEYIAWNKYPMREEKYSRMGHGFSHILKMMNDDIKQSIEKEFKNKENKKRSNSDENKNKSSEGNDSNIENEQRKNLATNININTSAKLPNLKHKHQKNRSIDDGVLDRIDSSPYDDIFADKFLAIKNKPQIMRIMKRNKNINMTNVMSSPKPFKELKEGYLYNTDNRIKETEKNKNIVSGAQTINTHNKLIKNLEIMNDEI